MSPNKEATHSSSSIGMSISSSLWVIDHLKLKLAVNHSASKNILLDVKHNSINLRIYEKSIETVYHTIQSPLEMAFSITFEELKKRFP